VLREVKTFVGFFRMDLLLPIKAGCISFASCGPQSCRNRPDPFPGATLYKMTKAGFILLWCMFG